MIYEWFYVELFHVEESSWIVSPQRGEESMLYFWIVKQNNSHGCAIQSVRPFIHNIQHTDHPSYHFSCNRESQSATLSITLFVIEEGEQSGEGMEEGW